MNNFLMQLQQLKQTFNGDPQQKIQQMLNSGQVSQAQYDEAVRKAKQIQQMINKM